MADIATIQCLQPVGPVDSWSPAIGSFRVLVSRGARRYERGGKCPLRISKRAEDQTTTGQTRTQLPMCVERVAIWHNLSSALALQPPSRQA